MCAFPCLLAASRDATLASYFCPGKEQRAESSPARTPACPGFPAPATPCPLLPYFTCPPCPLLITPQAPNSCPLRPLPPPPGWPAPAYPPELRLSTVGWSAAAGREEEGAAATHSYLLPPYLLPLPPDSLPPPTLTPPGSRSLPPAPTGSSSSGSGVTAVRQERLGMQGSTAGAAGRRTDQLIPGCGTRSTRHWRRLGQGPQHGALQVCSPRQGWAG